MANQDILDLQKNVKRGLRSKVEKGWYPQFAPLGYLNAEGDYIHKRVIVVDKQKSPYIIEAFKRYKSLE